MGEQGSSAHALQYSRDALAHADTHGGKAIACVLLLKNMSKRSGDPGAGAAERVAQCYGAAFDVDAVDPIV